MADPNQWKSLVREFKILQARKQASGTGRLPKKDEERLAFLAEHLGEAQEEKRIEISESEDKGPKVKTSDDHYATEIGKETLEKAAAYEPEKRWVKQEREQRAFEARDSRQGKATFRQQGLSQFAVELSEDLKGGELGISDAPQEEEAQARRDSHRAIMVNDEVDKFIKKSDGPKPNPFAIELDDGLARALGKAKTFDQSAVPDTAAKSFEVDLPEEEAEAITAAGRPAQRAEEISEELQGLLNKSYDLPAEKKKALSLGEATTHEAAEDEEANLDLDLMRQAVQYAEKKKLVEKDQSSWAVDEDGNEIEAKEPEDEAGAILSPVIPAADKPRPRFSDGKPTQPFAYAEPGSGELELPLPDAGSGEAAVELEISAEKESPTLTRNKPSIEYRPEDLPPPPASSAGVDNVPDLSEGSDPGARDFGQGPATVAPPTNASAATGGDALDAFWGLSGEQTQSAPQPPPPAKPPTPAPARWGGASTRPTVPTQPAARAQSEPVSLDELTVPEPAPAPPKPGRVLPALGAKRAPAAAPRPAEAPAAEPPRRRSLLGPSSDGSGSLVDSLFGEEPAATTEAEVTLPQGRRRAAAAAPVPSRGVVVAARGAKNDLKGSRRATVHFKDGVTRRGTVGEIDLDAASIQLTPQDGGAPESFNALALKTIFLLLPPGAAYPEKQGQRVRVVLIDGRTLQGSSTDYHPNRNAFTLFPAEDRGNIERIIVFNGAVKNIWFEEA
ncbi:MAG: hypothetical protein GYA21_08940 [Myxococcales bacterium]|nr:hypothetical protein [Myxococcales bacterium]